ncbi:MAG: hypothetical protein J7M21_04265 [Planctomycetes bacterium]|nr:hypothetical protein [Planctomycetota bacterium]
MRRIVTFILMAAVFLGGYYLGRRPGSPDILAHAYRGYVWARSAARQLAAALESPRAKSAAGGLYDTAGRCADELQRAARVRAEARRYARPSAADESYWPAGEPYARAETTRR